MDNTRQGHPRTQGMHQDMQIRDIQRHAAQETAQAADRGGLNVAMVVNVNPLGHVQLEGFTMANGDGTWFGVLNHITPRPGEFAIYGYVQGVPMVLGVVPTDETTPWRGPRSGLPDTFFIDDFEVGNYSAGGWPGTGKWTWANTAGSSYSLGYGSDVHPGHAQLGAGNAAGEYAYSHLLQNSIRPESIAEAEWMVQINPGLQSVASGLWEIGFTDHGLNLTQAIIARCDYNQNATWGSSWGFGQEQAALVGGAYTKVGDTGVNVVAAHWYKINFKHLLTPGEWRLTVTDVTDPVNPIEGVAEATGFQTTVLTTPYMRSYNRVATGEKWMYIDYVWWARRGLLRGAR